MSYPLTYDELVQTIIGCNCTPDFDERWFIDHYKNSYTIIPLICSCTEKFEMKCISLRNSKHCAKQCKKCSSKKRSSTMNTNSFNKFMQKVEDEGCKGLFTENQFATYKNEHLEFECSCGAKFKKSVQVFNREPRCIDCIELYKSKKFAVKRKPIILRKLKLYTSGFRIPYGDNKSENIDADIFIGKTEASDPIFFVKLMHISEREHFEKNNSDIRIKSLYYDASTKGELLQMEKQLFHYMIEVSLIKPRTNEVSEVVSYQIRKK